MDFRSSLGIVALATTVSITAAFAFDEGKYPNFSGVWRKPVGIGNQWDQTKPLGLAQELAGHPSRKLGVVLQGRCRLDLPAVAGNGPVTVLEDLRDLGDAKAEASPKAAKSARKSERARKSA